MRVVADIIYWKVRGSKNSVSLFNFVVFLFLCDMHIYKMYNQQCQIYQHEVFKISHGTVLSQWNELILLTLVKW